MPSRGLLFGPDELLIVAVVLKALKTVKASKLADLLVRCKRAVVKVDCKCPACLLRRDSDAFLLQVMVFNNLKLKFSR